MRMSVKYKIFAYLIGFCAVLIVLLWFFQVVFLETVYKQVKIWEIRNATATLAEHVGEESFAALADNMSESQEITIHVFSKSQENGQANLLYSSSPSRFETSSGAELRTSGDRFGGEMTGLHLDWFQPYLMAKEKGGEYFMYPEAEQIEAGRAVRERAEAVRSEANRSETAGANETRSEAVRSEAGQPEEGQTETGQPEAEQSEAGRPETGRLETGRLETGRVETIRPEAGRAGISAGDGILRARDLPPQSVGWISIQRPPQLISVYKIIDVTQNNPEYLMVINAVISPVNATVHTLRFELYFITIFMVVFSLLLAMLISRNVSKPIVALNRSAKEMAAGNLDICFDAKGYREIAELSETLNDTASELSRVEALRRELIANISHDLRTPLTLIAGYAEAIRDLPGENTPENFQIIVEEVKRLNGLVNDVLDMSRMETSGIELDCKPYDIMESIRETIGRLSEFLRESGYRIVFECAHSGVGTDGSSVSDENKGDGCTDFAQDGVVENREVDSDAAVLVLADRARIEQALYNLLINAINFTGEDRLVSVRLTVYDSDVLVTVKDSGEGISEKDLPNIWDRYYRCSETHRRGAVGSGIGLSIVKSVMDRHKAPYGVVSAPGKGSEFWIKLNRPDSVG